MSFDFSRLPVDLQKAVTSYLPPESLTKASPTSKLFQKMISNSPIWKITAEKLKLQNVTKENAQSKVLEYYQDLDLVKSFAKKCNDFSSQNLPKSYFSNRLENVATAIFYVLPKELQEELAVGEDGLTRLQSITKVVREHKQVNLIESFFERLFTVSSYADRYAAIFYLKIGAFDKATSEDFTQCLSKMFSPISDNYNPSEGSFELLSEILKVLHNNKSIDKKKLFEPILIEFAEKALIGKEYFTILLKEGIAPLMNQGMSPPDKAVEIATRLFIDNSIGAELFEDFLRHTPLKSLALKHIVEVVRKEKPDVKKWQARNEQKHNKSCDRALQMIDKIVKEKASVAKK